jgi:antitoxin component of MazEF toxin-antitoxin module
MSSLRERLEIKPDRLEAINKILLDPDMQVINNFLEVVSRYGTPEEINARAREARKMDNLLAKVQHTSPEHLKDLEWLQEKVDQGAFITMDQYRERILGSRAEEVEFPEDYAVTLEISACQYFPWVRMIAERALEHDLLMPERFIRVRKMKEQEHDGDLAAFAAAMQILGGSYVETLDTKGTDGSNVHLGGPETITGYFGGVGQPNDHALKWLDEYLYYYTEYGVRQVLNINPGTVLLGYMLHRLGVDNEFKISVFMGNDNPYAALWTLVGAKLFARDDGTSPLIGFNWSNSVDNQTMELTAQFRKDLGFEEVVRFEHHITETFRSIVIQPYNRRGELVELADHVANISAKHEGGDPEIEETREHPSDILDYFRDKAEIIESGDWEALTLNFRDKFDALNKTAHALTDQGLAVRAAPNLHHT